jgi:predicted glycosyltransferase
LILRIVMYWHNGRSLGHTAGTAKIAHALVRDLPALNLAGLTGAFRGLDLLPEQMDIVKLPAFVNYDRPSGWNTAGRQGLDHRTLFRVRAELCDIFLRHFQPDLLLVNHIPLGAEGELVPALSASRTGPRVLTLRGILFDREKTNREYFGPHVGRWIGEQFDAIWIYTDPNIFSLENAYDIPVHLRERIRYTGYLAAPLPFTRAEIRRKLGIGEDERWVVATMGGGQGALHIWHAIIEALARNRLLFDFAYFVTGPYLEIEDRAALTAATTSLSWLRIAAYDPDLTAWMAGADLVIGAAGSNILSEILANGCNAVVISRQIREPEQRMHSALLAKRRLVRACSLDEVQAGALPNVIAESFREPLHPHGILLDGASRFPAFIHELMGTSG